MKLSDFDFELPDDRIARHPVEKRDRSRLLVLNRTTGQLSHHRFHELPALLGPGDLLVSNNSRVLPARLYTQKVGTGGKIEALLVEPVEDQVGEVWRAMLSSSKKVKEGQKLSLAADQSIVLEVLKKESEGFCWLGLPQSAQSIAQKHGELPLPPYLGRKTEPEDSSRYQTIYSEGQVPRSVAAPTAGLHFTPEVFGELSQKGVGHCSVTLHVGPGTFLPVRGDSIEEHVMHQEHFLLSEESVRTIERAKAEDRRIVAVGTTVTRVLESLPQGLKVGPGATRLFIKPGHEFAHVGALLTNFHLPKSTLLILVSAFAGYDLTMKAYRTAVEEGYRFFSYGDAMLIL